jgi:bacterial/archaeal transporter family-2 protein
MHNLTALFTKTVLCTDRLGAAVVLSCSVAAQVVLSVFLDHFAVLELQQKEASWSRILGAVLVAAGAVLIGVTS